LATLSELAGLHVEANVPGLRFKQPVRVIERFVVQAVVDRRLLALTA
jgi:hypothetical protein